ncbi:TetR/AcrR family transcriptional regulator [Loigolactobacillus coryniformis]|jgi:AcrR family transcriptional regulator|uniref:TetR/AcrR family transcriptional regulator n=1 Tax=Loigolactobacillus coryniformis TaxID=1610 RepID=UPI00345D7BCA
MVSTTFKNLAPDKQARIQSALLNEFSAHPLADAQVARIVQQAQIARGAFYKYFTDLTDAYRYLYHQVMLEIHSAIPPTAFKTFTPAIYLQAVRDFVDQAADSQYRELIKRHLTQNEALLAAPKQPVMDIPDAVWAAGILSHETIKQVLLYPDTKKAALDRLASALEALARKDE